MSYAKIASLLTPQHAEALAVVKTASEKLLDHTPRFRFFTLHGKAHLENLFRIFDILIQGGIRLSEQEIYLLSLSICIHDLGMVCALRDSEVAEVLDGPSEFADPPALEDFIRETHHNRVETYLEDNAAFLTSAGVSPPEIQHVREISRAHRKVILQQQSGFIKHLGALLRVIDELDITYERAPADVLRNNYREMESTSCWHWFKHNITEPWQVGHTVNYISNNSRQSIVFRVGVSPTASRTIPYWSTQTLKPIVRVLRDEGAGMIIKERFDIAVVAEIDHELCKVNRLDTTWQEIEHRALSSSHPVILVVDDEFSKCRDLFLPLSEKYNIISAIDANDALIKAEAARPRLVIVDLQMSSGGIWDDKGTSNFKLTGLRLCEELQSRFPDMRLGILTGTRHVLPDMSHINVAFTLRKPVDLDYFTDKVIRVLS